MRKKAKMGARWTRPLAEALGTVLRAVVAAEGTAGGAGAGAGAGGDSTAARAALDRLMSAEGEGAPPVSIIIGHWEARALVMAIEEEDFLRPLSYDLLEQALERLKGEVKYLVVHSLKDNTYFGKLHIDTPDGEWVLDCRPSDGMVIVTRVGAPIYVTPQLFKKEILIREA